MPRPMPLMTESMDLNDAATRLARDRGLGDDHQRAARVIMGAIIASGETSHSNALRLVHNAINDPDYLLRLDIAVRQGAMSSDEVARALDDTQRDMFSGGQP